MEDRLDGWLENGGGRGSKGTVFDSMTADRKRGRGRNSFPLDIRIERAAVSRSVIETPRCYGKLCFSQLGLALFFFEIARNRSRSREGKIGERKISGERFLFLGKGEVRLTFPLSLWR